MGTLTDHTALVTGAGSGIGRAIALRLAQAGARLWLVGRRPEALAATAEAAGGRAEIWPADLAAPEALQTLAAQVAAQPWDVLVHSAGVYAMGTLAATPVTALDEQYAVNVRAPYVLTQAALPGLKARGGQVVFINSTAGLTARAQVGAYAASKHALKALADSLREEVNADGVRVLSVFPGRTASPMQARVFAAEGRAYAPEALLQPEAVAELVTTALEMPRTAEVTDLHVRPMRKA